MHIAILCYWCLPSRNGVLMLMLIICVAVWYAVAYYGLRDWQRHGFFGPLGESPEERFLVWLFSPVPLIGVPAIYCAARRTFRFVACAVRPLARWMFK